MLQGQLERDDLSPEERQLILESARGAVDKEYEKDSENKRFLDGMFTKAAAGAGLANAQPRRRIAPDALAQPGNVLRRLAERRGFVWQEPMRDHHPAAVKELLRFRQRAVGDYLHRRDDEAS